MPAKTFEIRACQSCGLRYPLVDKRAGGIRCPICLGETRLLLQRELSYEPTRDSTSIYSPTLVTPSPLGDGSLNVLLDNVRSAGNVGSILRSAEGFGFSHAYLCGITPTPENTSVQKTSLGAEETVTWSYHKDAVKLVKGLKNQGWKIFALEEGGKSKDIGLAPNFLKPTQHHVLIVGNEITGVDPGLLELCEKIFFIPMVGEKKSFNVAVAFGIAAHAIRAER